MPAEAAGAVGVASAEALRFQQTLLECQTEAVLDALLVIAADGRVATLNRRFAELWRLPPEVVARRDRQAITARILELVADPQAYLDRSDYLAHHPDEVVAGELALRDGRVLEHYSTPIRDEDGTFYGRLGCYRDITERRRAEARLRLLAEAGRAFAAAPLDLAAVLEVVTRTIAGALGAELGAVVALVEDGATFEVLYQQGYGGDGAAAQKVMREWRRFPASAPTPVADAVRSGEPVILEDSAARAARYPHLAGVGAAIGEGAAVALPLIADGRPLGALHLRFAGGRTFDAGDRAFMLTLAGHCAQALDRARLYEAERQARAQAQDAVRARDEFLSVAAHELRTPVTTIKGQAQLLQRFHRRGTLDEARLARGLDQIAASGDRLAALTNDLLDVSRLQTGHFELRAIPLDLAAFVREVVERHAEQADERHSLTFAADAPCPVRADPVRLEQVVANLLSNAVKYSPEGGPVEVTVRGEAGGALLTVQDRGIGLPPGAAEAIFEPFGRAANAAARQLPGLGLGLYLCRQIVERHGGRIWAESPGEGEGTTVWVWLPGDEAGPGAPGRPPPG